MLALAEILDRDEKSPVDDDARQQKANGDKITVADLVAYFEDAEEATQTARGLSERDRDYYDNIQLTADELKVLKLRGQPPVIANAISRKINYLVGLEKEQRVKPKAMPRTPQHEADADSATEALRYVVEDQNYGHKRSSVWKNMLIEGAGGFAVAVKPSKYQASPTVNPPVGAGAPGGMLPPAAGMQPPSPYASAAPQGQPSPGFAGELVSSTAMTAPSGQQYDVELRRIPWDRMFADPHSSEPDYSDAGYLGVVLWMDFNDAIATYGEDAREALETTLRSTSSQTYDDRPKFRLWADRKRKRVRVCQIWIKRGEEWHFAEFTQGGILKHGPSPYKTDIGESDCELIFQSAYVNRENERYGEVRGMISPQDEKNKRRSKALHLLSTNQVIYEDGAVDDIERTRKETARADGTIKLNPNYYDKFKFETRTEMAAGQMELLAESNREMDLAGPNATQLGDKTGNSSSASGKAIIASQQGGMIQMGDLMDNLRHLDMRVFRATWFRIRQFWTGEKWVRVTDDERNLKWVGVNTDKEAVKDPQTGQTVMRPKMDPATGQPLPPTKLAELDCDITIDDAPDSVTPQLEQWQSLVELRKSGVNLPDDVLIQSAPNLKNKDAILEGMKKPPPGAEMAQQMQQLMAQLQLALGKAKVADTEASAQLKQANAMKAQREAMAPPEQGAVPEMPGPLEHEQALADLYNTAADTDLKKANEALARSKVGQTAAQTEATQQQTALRPAEFMAGREDAADRSNLAAARQAQPPRTLQ